MTQAFARSVLVNRPSRTVNDYLTFLDRAARAVGLELDFARASGHAGVEHQGRHKSER